MFNPIKGPVGLIAVLIFLGGCASTQIPEKSEEIAGSAELQPASAEAEPQKEPDPEVVERERIAKEQAELQFEEFERLKQEKLEREKFAFKQFMDTVVCGEIRAHATGRIMQICIYTVAKDAAQSIDEIGNLAHELHVKNAWQPLSDYQRMRIATGDINPSCIVIVNHAAATFTVHVDGVHYGLPFVEASRDAISDYCAYGSPDVSKQTVQNND